jgi:hypothetical protein
MKSKTPPNNHFLSSFWIQTANGNWTWSTQYPGTGVGAIVVWVMDIYSFKPMVLEHRHLSK